MLDVIKEILANKKFMNKLILVSCLLFLNQILNAQQVLWTTATDIDFESTSIEYVSIEKATRKILDLYDFYELYYDETGYSKRDFFKMLDRYDEDSESWENINEIKELTVFALKNNLGQSSIVLVVIISSRGIDALMFTNNYEPDAIFTTPYDKPKFEKWLNSLLK
ncbi:hypothetical protein GWK08_08010 [Leptobacterium flavescens]|uniref:Uncharacterized protein n=1 Tax=Leptobacterium flavescens TaxID=472055 RepID=A0A6P0UNC1_9FLAO|nr:hypothetical protein [Leptobacterium flavescens]NER13378.1 hypothetical protein [Leptobacterium flavescens]